MQHDRPSHPRKYTGDLRNRSFKGKDLRGADFSHADIRGCNFENADLTGASFAKAKAGQSRRQRLIFIGVAIVSAIAVAFAFAVAVAFAVAFAVAVAVAVAGTFAGAGAGAGAFAVAGAGAVAGAVASRAIAAFAKGAILEGVFFSVVALIFAGLALYFFRELVKAYRTFPGTQFKNAILTGADFNHAILHNTDFSDAKDVQVNWTGAVFWRSSFDENGRVNRLITSRNGHKGDYSHANLANEYLCGVDLSRANLHAADLSNANLHHADLRDADLSDAQALGTNFSSATLTGACIQNWGINPETSFTDVRCDYIYLFPGETPENRRPLTGSFAPGDFEKLVDKFADTLDFILRQGIDPSVFRLALQQLHHDYPGAAITGFIALDDERVLVQVTVPETTNKVEAYTQFQGNLETLTAELEATRRDFYRLEGSNVALEKENAKLEKQNETMMERLFKLENKQYITTAHFYGDTMTDKSTNPKITGNKGDVFYVGRDVDGVVGKDQTGVVGQMEGDLTLTIDHLKQSPDPKAVQLADLLKQVKTAIDSPTAGLDDKHKARAQKYLTELGKMAGGSDRSPDLLEKADETLDNLEGLIKKGSGLAEFAQKHLPTFTAIVRGLLGI